MVLPRWILGQTGALGGTGAPVLPSGTQRRNEIGFTVKSRAYTQRRAVDNSRFARTEVVIPQPPDGQLLATVELKDPDETLLL